MTSLRLDPEKPWMSHIYVDGSVRPGGAAACAFLIFHQPKMAIVAFEKHAYRGRTINAMELMAINLALDYPNTKYVTIYSDSQYCISALTVWYKNWQRNDWKTPLGEPVKNKELIQEILDKLKTRKYHRFVKVPAHRGDPLNGMVDWAAQSLTKEMVSNPRLKDGSHPITNPV